MVPGRIIFLLIGQSEGGVHVGVVHDVVNQTVGFWVETLRGEERRRRYDTSSRPCGVFPYERVVTVTME